MPGCLFWAGMYGEPMLAAGGGRRARIGSRSDIQVRTFPHTLGVRGLRQLPTWVGIPNRPTASLATWSCVAHLNREKPRNPSDSLGIRSKIVSGELPVADSNRQPWKRVGVVDRLPIRNAIQVWQGARVPVKNK